MGIARNKSIMFSVLMLTIIALSLVYSQIVVVPSVQASTATVTLNPTADSYVDYNDPNTNYGASSYLNVWEIYTGYLNFGYISYLKFDLSSIPSNATINSAELKLYLYSNVSQTSSVEAHYVPSNTWTETGITWNNAPSCQATPTYTVSGIAFKGWYSWVITGDVQTALSNRVLSVALLPGVPCDSICSFYSKDAYYSENRPKLVISYTTPKSSSSISCSASSSIGPGESITVSGSISPPPSGTATVTLTYTRPNGTQVIRTTTARAGSGSYADTYAPDLAGTWTLSASWAGNDDYLGATSSTVSFTVKAPSSISCSTNSISITIGQTITVSGTLTPARSGTAITLTYTRPDGTPITRTVTTTTGGSFSDVLTPDQGGSWKVKAGWAGDAGYVGSESAFTTFNVAKLSSSITCSASSDKIEKGKSITISGSISPSHAGVMVTLTYKKPDGSTENILVISNVDGSFEDNYLPENLGSWKVTASWEGDDDHLGATSSPVTFSVEEIPGLPWIMVTAILMTVMVAAVGIFLWKR